MKILCSDENKEFFSNKTANENYRGFAGLIKVKLRFIIIIL
jgi:hypothetical protein